MRLCPHDCCAMIQPFLRIPPFPGHRAEPLARAASALPGEEQVSAGPDSTRPAIAERLRQARVGGPFWGLSPSATGPFAIILCPADAGQLSAMLDDLRQQGRLDDAAICGKFASAARKAGVACLPADTDLWPLCEQAELVIADANHEVALVAALTGTALQIVGQGRFAALTSPQSNRLRPSTCRGFEFGKVGKSLDRLSPTLQGKGNRGGGPQHINHDGRIGATLRRGQHLGHRF